MGTAPARSSVGNSSAHIVFRVGATPPCIVVGRYAVGDGQLMEIRNYAYHMALSLGASTYDAEDAAQEVAIKFHANPQYTPRKGFIYLLTKHSLITSWRKREGTTSKNLSPRMLPLADNRKRLGQGSVLPEETLAIKMQLEAIKGFLSPQDWVFVLAYLNKETPRTATEKSKIRRIREKLRRRFQR